MIYADSSSVLKLFWNEPESAAVIAAISAETLVVISALTEVEVLVQLKAAWLAGDYSRSEFRRLESRFALLRNQEPYEFVPLDGMLFQTALRQHRNSGKVHCRTLDRLHLAAMEELGVDRLMTNDEPQSKAALAAGLDVVFPRGNL